ncbi:MAG TPA: CPBP family intramembrane glutamic endopeptidase [Silvibacterium sp.]|nr:CPBP family intramembrane glutamic endopeptidase [Silvibacterium sp.]
MFDPAPRSDSNLDAVPEALQDWQLPAPLQGYPSFPPPATSPQRTNIPNLAHTFLFFALAIVILMLGEIITVGIGHHLPPFRHEDFTALASDPRLMIPAQALQYLVLLGLTTMIFGALWNAPFWTTLRWNASAVARRWIVLVGIGLLLGLGSSLAGNYLPMPKEAPILNDLMNSTLGAWLMFLFGTTGAPLIEELAFRGFLLPSLINAFRWLERSGRITHTTMALLGVPISILLTSLPFALLHSLQVSYAWAPVLLIGVVSIVLCVVRLWTNSFAASTLVHATYNFSLFAGMLIASDGFRHLEKLNS